MSNIVRRTDNAAPVRGRTTGRPGSVADYRRPDLVVDGRPIDYTDREFTVDEAWELLPAATSAWATQHAGAAIHDPVTKQDKQYCWCDVVRTGGSFDGATSAEYTLIMFGTRGLVVARGTTDRFTLDGRRKNQWRTSRWDIPIDPAQIRHDHRTAARPHKPRPGPTTDADRSGDIASDLLGDEAAMFGHLPDTTQEFLLHAFLGSGTEPQNVGVMAIRTTESRRETDEVWTYLFNRRQVAFSYARRSARKFVPRHDVDEAPWDVAAWAAPALPVPKPTLPRRSRSLTTVQTPDCLPHGLKQDSASG